MTKSSGKTALVTGSTDGVGRMVAERLGAERAAVEVDRGSAVAHDQARGHRLQVLGDRRDVHWRQLPLRARFGPILRPRALPEGRLVW